MKELKDLIPSIHDFVNNLQDYFVSKILDLKFEVIDISEYTMQILIDYKYQFTIWIGNIDLPYTIEPKTGIGYCYFMELEFTEEQSIELATKLPPIIKEAKEKFIYPEKLEQFNKLKEELGL